MDYVERVRKLLDQEKKNVHVEACKDYIARNLRKHFRVSDISEALHLNQSYLSKIFMKYEQLTLQQYIAKERCIHAANMLRFTDFSIPVIAEYFCFATQSHLGTQFKKFYGMTPGEYRKRYANKNF